MTENNNCYHYSILIFVSLILSSCLIILPITEIYFGISYKEEIICDSSIIPIYEWLIIKGILNIIFIILSIIVVISTDKSLLYCICMPIVILYQFFNFIWVVIGTVIFFRDCPSLEPVSINTLMYFSIIIGYFSVLNNNFISSYKKEKYTESRPMLNV